MSRRAAVLAIGAIVTVISLYLALRGTDFGALGQILGRAQLEYVPLLLLCLVVFYSLKVLRWNRLLRIDGLAPSVQRLTGPMMIGFAANNLLPFRLGELIRVVLGARQTDLPHGTVLASIVVERVFDLIALLVIASVAWAIGQDQNMTHPIMQFVVLLAVGASLGLVVIAFASRHVFRALHRLDLEQRGRWLRLVVDKAQTVENGMQSIQQPVQVARILTNSLIQWMAMILVIVFACHAVGTQIDYTTGAYLLLLVTIAISIPSTPGFIGVIEYSFVLGLGSFGVSADNALAAAIFYHATNWIAVTLTGTYFLQRYSLSWSELAQTRRNS